MRESLPGKLGLSLREGVGPLGERKPRVFLAQSTGKVGKKKKKWRGGPKNSAGLRDENAQEHPALSKNPLD